MKQQIKKETLAKALKDLAKKEPSKPPKTDTLTFSGAVEASYDAIKSALKRGLTYADIAASLKDSGIKTTPSGIRSEMSRITKNREAKTNNAVVEESKNEAQE